MPSDKLCANAKVEREMVGGQGNPRWSHFHHEADMGIRGIGPTAEAAFEQAGLALTAVICDPGLVNAETRVEIECSAADREYLFVEWIDALIYEMATRGMLFGRYRVRISGNTLQAEATGEPIDTGRHEPAVEVKGATLTGLSVRREKDHWVAECVVDV